MKVRYGLAAVFVAVVAALIAVRDAGYLGGRTPDGPLTLTVAGEATVRPGETATFLARMRLDGGPVQMQDIDPVFRSPGLTFRRPRIGERYARVNPRVEGATLVGDEIVGFGLRARRPGVYYVRGLTTDYRRGARRFRDEDDEVVCLAVGKRRACAPGFAVPDVRLAEVGGPSGRRRVTLTNLTRSTFEVSDIEVPGGTSPESFTLQRGEAGTVRLAGCVDADVLRAKIDGDPVEVPLSAPLTC